MSRFYKKNDGLLGRVFRILTYDLKQALKEQVLADFVLEITYCEDLDDVNSCIIHVDGSSNKKGRGVGVVM